jgi:hypothetical protein
MYAEFLLRNNYICPDNAERFLNIVASDKKLAIIIPKSSQQNEFIQVMHSMQYASSLSNIFYECISYKTSLFVNLKTISNPYEFTFPHIY